jgi:hypothetical protein
MPPKKKQRPSAPHAKDSVIEGVDAAIRGFSANPDAPSFHASSVSLLATPIDFVLVVGQLETSPEGANMKKAVTLFFSPGHAKQLAQILTSRVAEHEAQFGPIAPQFFGE